MRNFLYNKSDILVAILIIVVAAGVVYLRVGVIMEYSSSKAAASNEVAQEEEPLQDSEIIDTASEDVVVAEEETEEPAEEVAEETPAEPEIVQIQIVQGDVASTAGDKLLAAGLISDKAAFVAAVEAKGVASYLQLGTFDIAKGTSQDDIITKLFR